MGRPATVLCTSTLELGIDVGAVKSVAQVGVPPSVASLRQRLGRSGRGEEPAVLRMYVEENELDKDSSLHDALRLQLIEAIAMIDLLLRGWCEPQNEERLHLSTLVHQVLALVAERGGVRATEAFRLLCVTGPFRQVLAREFGELLRAMGAHDLLVQMDDGLLVLGVRGEREVEHYSFFAVFKTPEEFRIVAEAATLGSLPMSKPVIPEQLIIFAGRWWEVLEVDASSKTITVRATRRGHAPPFDGDGGLVDDIVRAEMLRVLSSANVPRYLNPGARRLLEEGRETFRRYGLAETMAVDVGGNVVLLPWLGDRKLTTLQLLLAHVGFTRVERYNAVLVVERASTSDVVARMRALSEERVPDGVELAERAEILAREKYDELLPDELARRNFASVSLDLAPKSLVELFAGAEQG